MLKAFKNKWNFIAYIPKSMIKHIRVWSPHENSFKNVWHFTTCMLKLPWHRKYILRNIFFETLKSSLAIFLGVCGIRETRFWKCRMRVENYTPTHAPAARMTVVSKLPPNNTKWARFKLKLHILLCWNKKGGHVVGNITASKSKLCIMIKHQICF